MLLATSSYRCRPKTLSGFSPIARSPDEDSRRLQPERQVGFGATKTRSMARLLTIQKSELRCKPCDSLSKVGQTARSAKPACGTRCETADRSSMLPTNRPSARSPRPRFFWRCWTQCKHQSLSSCHRDAPATTVSPGSPYIPARNMSGAVGFGCCTFDCSTMLRGKTGRGNPQ